MSHYSTLHLLHVEQLPRSRQEISLAITTTVRRALDACAALPSCISDAERLTCVHGAHRMIPLEVKLAAAVKQDQAIAMERPEEHDAFFHIVRVEGAPLHVLVHSILHAYGEVLEDALVEGTSLTPNEWGRLLGAFDTMLNYILLGSVTPPAIPFQDDACAAGCAREHHDPLRRWRIGHHVFLTLIQNLVVTFGCFGGALLLDDLSSAGTVLELATVLMWGSASALRFAGDFHPQQYETVVRPAMMPPHLEPGFSGLQSRDHYYLIKSLARLKPAFKALDPSLHLRHRQFIRAFDATYEAHKFVCAQFKGDQQPSLRMNMDMRQSAVDVIDQLKHARMRNIQP